MITFDDDGVVCPLFSISDNKIDNYRNLLITALNESRFLYDGSTTFGDNSEFSDLSFL